MNQDEMQRRLDEDGFYIVPSALSAAELQQARDGLARGVEAARQRGMQHDARLDPNDANIRVYNLPALAPIFMELLRRPDALGAARAVLGPHAMVSNFTANIALPGSGQMKLHSDQALVVPPPWPHPWSCNVIWCLDDVTAANGATRYLPGSHRFRAMEDVPADAMAKTLPFEAPAGSFVVMEGRLWHTSGRNVTQDEQRRMMFAYYSADFIRPQMNWAMSLPQAVQDGMDDELRTLFGLTAMGNVRIGGGLTRLAPAQAA